MKPIEADNARARQVLADVVLPGWVKRCGARCGDVFNENGRADHRRASTGGK